MAWYNDFGTDVAFRLGTVKTSVDNKKFIFLTGVASTVLGDWVTFDEAHLTIRAVANGIGRVGVAMSANVASNYGWYQIYGSASGKALASFADDGAVYLTATAGSVDDADVGGDAVLNAWGRSAVNTTTSLATFELNFPSTMNIALD